MNNPTNNQGKWTRGKCGARSRVRLRRRYCRSQQGPSPLDGSQGEPGRGRMGRSGARKGECLRVPGTSDYRDGP